MASLLTLERRIIALEARLAEIESAYGDTLYEVKREVIENRLNMGLLLGHFGIPPVTSEAVDAVLEDNS